MNLDNILDLKCKIVSITVGFKLDKPFVNYKKDSYNTDKCILCQIYIIRKHRKNAGKKHPSAACKPPFKAWYYTV